MAETHDPGRESGRQLDRVNAFSDGVFSIAATLLVLSIDVPDGPADTLGDQLRALEGPVSSYFVSFAVVGLFWFYHHRMLGTLRASDTRFAMYNLAFLAFVALIPAPTELLGRYGDAPAATVIYALNVIILILLSRNLGRYAQKHGLNDVEPDAHREPFIAHWAAIIAFGLSIPLAFVAPADARWVWLLAAILPFIAHRIGRRREPPAIAQG